MTARGMVGKTLVDIFGDGKAHTMHDIVEFYIDARKPIARTDAIGIIRRLIHWRLIEKISDINPKQYRITEKGRQLVMAAHLRNTYPWVGRDSIDFPEDARRKKCIKKVPWYMRSKVPIYDYNKVPPDIFDDIPLGGKEIYSNHAAGEGKTYDLISVVVEEEGFMETWMRNNREMRFVHYDRNMGLRYIHGFVRGSGRD